MTCAHRTRPRNLQATDTHHKLLKQLGPYHFLGKLIPLMIIKGLAEGVLPIYGDGVDGARTGIWL
jgi:dTDP-D-glucose 4,6-dehydratase